MSFCVLSFLFSSSFPTTTTILPYFCKKILIESSNNKDGAKEENCT